MILKCMKIWRVFYNKFADYVLTNILGIVLHTSDAAVIAIWQGVTEHSYF